MSKSATPVVCISVLLPVLEEAVEGVMNTCYAFICMHTVNARHVRECSYPISASGIQG